MKRDDLLGWLKGSRRTTAVTKATTRPRMTSEIHQEAFNGVVSLSNTSEILKRLLENGLVVCINPTERNGKLYMLTKTGKTIRNKMYGSESSYEDVPNRILKDYGWVVRGEHRRAVIKVMDGRKTPSRIHRDVARTCESLPINSINCVKLSLNSTSDTLRGFRKKGIAICINPEKKVGRLYELTKKGKVVREQILTE